MVKSSLSVCILIFALMASGCDSITNLFSGSGRNAEIEKAYLDYRSAMTAGDIQALRNLVVKQKARELDAPEAGQMLALARAMYPANATITGVTVQGDTATLTASGPVAGGSMEGIVHLLKEDNAWKVYDEKWEMKIGMAQPQASSGQSDARRPYEYQKITGTWKGHEAGQSTDDWEFTLGGAYDLAATGPGGQHYQADAMVDDSLGAEGGSLRVLPGGAPFDLRITASSSASEIGKISLGSYKLMGDTLQLCGGEPGLMKRTSNFASSGGIRCFELKRTSGPIEMQTAPQPAAEPSLPQPVSPQTGASSFSKQDPNVSGEALVVKDGQTETYPLVTGFFSDTRFTNPSRATIQFQAPGPAHSNARRIEITLDATKTGSHVADGKSLSESFMGEDKIRIGEHGPQGYLASFRWVADGGQIFWPKTSCVISITSAYTGSASSVFSGEVHDCPVHSAGIDYTISSLKFTMRGAPSR